jgi:hypothetical protein
LGLVSSALADPGVRVDYREGLLRVTLEGAYGGSYYQVFRGGERAGSYNPLGSDYTLCTGDCFVTDFQALPGETYFYRFDVYPAGGGLVSYGPYPVTVPDTPLGVRAWPNPSNRAMTIELALPGDTRLQGAVTADARLIDLQGRLVRTLHSGVIQRGLTTLNWDGRGDRGQELGAGIYFLRVTSPFGTRTTRILRTP